MPDVDGDAFRRARAETLGEQHTYTLAKKKYALVPELSVIGALAFAKIKLGIASFNDVREFLTAALVNEKDVDVLLEAGFLPSDAEALAAAWSMEPGESSASPPSSNGGGAPSKRTSTRSTKSASRTRSGSRK